MPKMREWMYGMYRAEPEGDGGDDGAGFSDATADNLSDMYDEGFDRIPPAAPVAPAAAPAAAPVSTPSQPSAPATPVAPAAPAQPQPAAPAVQPQAAPAAAPAEPSVPAAAPAAAPAVEGVPAAPVQPAAPVETPEQEQARLSGERTKLVGELEKQYAIPEAELESFRDSPETYLPKMAAKLHVEVLTAVANGLFAQLPVMIQNYQRMQTQQTDHETRFFSRWQKLGTPELKPKVMEMVRTYRQFNPRATFETLMDEVGAMAHVRFRIPFEDTGAQPGAPAAAPAASAAPAARPFVPAGAGGSGPPTSPAETNQFTQLANEFLSEPGGW